MSESQLGIQIRATDTATATIKQLERALLDTQVQIRNLKAASQEASAAALQGFQQTATAIQTELRFRYEQVAAIKQLQRETVEQVKATQALSREQTSAAQTAVQANNAALAAAERAAKQQQEMIAEQKKIIASAEQAAAAQVAMADKIAKAEEAAYAKAVAAAEMAAKRQIAAMEKTAAEAERLAVRQKAIAEAGAAAVVHRNLSQNLDASFGIRNIDTSSVGARLQRADQQAMYSRMFGGSEGGGVGGGLGRGGVGTGYREARHVVAGFDELARGQRGAFISTLGAAARDAGLGVSALTAAMIALGAAMATAAVLRKAEELGKWATQARAAASAAGISVTEYTALQAVLRSLGLNIDESDTALKRLARSLNDAVADPSSKVAEAFKNIGISQQELAKNNGDVMGGLKLLSQAFNSTADGANKTANMEEILGRGFERLIPLLNRAGGELDQQIEKQKELGRVIDEEGAVKLEKLGNAVRHLGETIEGEGTKAMIHWADSIRTVVEFLDRAASGVGKVAKSIDEIGKTTVGKLLFATGPSALFARFATGSEKPTDGGAGAAGVAGDVTWGNLGPAKRAVAPLEAPIRPGALMRNQMSTAAVTATAGLTDPKKIAEATYKAEIDVMTKTLATANLTKEQRLTIETELNEKILALQREQASVGVAAEKQSVHDYIAAEKTKIAEAQGSSEKILAIYTEMLDALRTKYHATAAQISTIQTEMVKEMAKSMRDSVKEQAEDTKLLLSMKKALSEGSAVAAGTYGIKGVPTIGGQSQQRGQSTADLIARSQEIENAANKDIAVEQQIMSMAGEDSDTRREAARKILEIETQSLQERVQLYTQAATTTAQLNAAQSRNITRLFDQVGSSFDSFSSSMMKALVDPQREILKVGLTSRAISLQRNEMRQAMNGLSMSLMGSFVQSMQHSASQMLAQGLSKMLNVPMEAGGGLSSLLGAGVSKLFGVGQEATQAAQFGIAATSLDTAAFNLNGAALALTTAAGAAGSGGVAAAGALSVAPITAAIAASDATDTGLTTAQTTTLTTAQAASTSAIVSAITATGTSEDILLSSLNLKPSAFGFTYAEGGIVPSAAGGMIVGDLGVGGIPSILHAQEMVLPAPISRGLQGMIAQGNAGGAGRSNVNSMNYAPTINTMPKGKGGTGMSRAELSQMLSSHAGEMAGMGRNMMGRGWRPA
jgi:hypothetical protein